MAGPLSGVRIVEMGGIGPGPFAAMMLADSGADILRIERPGANPNESSSMMRNRRRVTVDVKSPDGLEAIKRLAAEADGLIEGFRPGAMERLGLGPDVLLQLNPKLVYGRMTGWGQTGPFASSAGHDINYIAISGALHSVGRRGAAPVAPPALIGDFGGGGMMLAFSMCAALLNAAKTGKGEVIDCAMSDGSGVLMTAFHEGLARGSWIDERGANVVDSGAHYYDAYETADGAFVSIGAIEPQFYATLRKLTGLDADPAFDAQNDRGQWPALHDKIAALFKTKTRAEWCDLLEYTDACFAPVLSLTEAPEHPHAKARGSFVTIDGVVQPAPAPRYAHAQLDTPRACEQV
ncbi:CaiB/BaiF CoA-transferase family protein, partial [Phenylobacterium sp.]|uniref:CaiB/BaiF CoA transferase family protein n=1 Tax=Phenylobacterium sp. TaxID=1871053 RepID=UPI0027352520